MSPLPVAGCNSTIGAPGPPVSQYQSCVPGIGAMASLAGACAGIGVGVIGLVWLWAALASTAKPSPKFKAHNGQATLRFIALLPSLCVLGTMISGGAQAAKAFRLGKFIAR